MFNLLPPKRCGPARLQGAPDLHHTHILLSPQERGAPFHARRLTRTRRRHCLFVIQARAGRRKQRCRRWRVLNLSGLRDGFHPSFIRECGQAPRPAFTQSEAPAERQPAYPSGPSSFQDAPSTSQVLREAANQHSTCLARLKRPGHTPTRAADAKPKANRTGVALPQSTIGKLKRCT